MSLIRSYALHNIPIALRGTILLLALAGTLASVSAQAPAKQDMDQVSQHLMEAEVSYEKMQPKGMAIEAKEISRSGQSDKDLVVHYHVYIRGAKSGAVFQEIDWPITADQPVKSVAGISLGADGVLMCPENQTAQCGTSKPGSPLELVTHPKPGEPTRLAFESEGVKIGLVLVPDPIKSKDKVCALEAIRLTPNFEVAYITGSGYTANSDVPYKLTPLSDKAFVVKADAAGVIRTSVAPQAGGNASIGITVKVEEADCSPEVSYVWSST